MRRLIRRITASNRSDDRGAVLVWVAGSMVAFLGFSALAVDLGYLYVRTTQLQNAADAAATAGVVHIPNNPAAAESDARNAANANGFPQPGGVDVTTVLDDNSLQARLSTEVETFFLRALGRDHFDVVREARAEYIKPVRLGSPTGQFGGTSQEFWAAINGQYTDRDQGDPYATRCINMGSGGSPGCSSGNPWYRDGGYYYGVEVAPGTSSLTVSFYDPGHFLEADGGTRPYPHPGDTSWEPDWGGVELEAVLFEPDTTINDPTDNSVVAVGNRTCSGTSSAYFGATGPGGGYQSWVNLCTISSPAPGLYVLQLPAPVYEGSSKFAIRATTSGAGAGYEPAKLYGLLDMSIHVNNEDGSPRPWLAEVLPEHDGKTFEIDIFDIGESDTMNLQILGPGGSTVGCSWSSTKSGEGPGFDPDCTFDVGGRRFNAEWLYLSIDLDDYSCDPDAGGGTGCWWRVSITDMDNPTDRTTWAARIAGNPIQLTP